MVPVGSRNEPRTCPGLSLLARRAGGCSDSSSGLADLQGCTVAVEDWALMGGLGVLPFLIVEVIKVLQRR